MNPTPDRSFSFFFLGALFLLSLGLVYWMMTPFIEPIFVAFVLAVAFAPLHGRLRRWLKRDGLAAFAATIFVLVVVLLPLVFMGIIFVQQGLAVYEQLAQQSSARGGWRGWLAGSLEGPVAFVAQRTGLKPLDIEAALLQWLGTQSQRMLGWSGTLFSNVGRSIAETTIVFFTLFFFFLQGKGLRRGAVSWLPIESSRAEKLLKVTTDAINANLFGVLVVSTVQGALLAVSFLICGFGSWFFWGVVASFASLIPMVGTAVVWAPAAIAMFSSGHWGKGLFLVLWGVFVIGMSDNFIRPWVVSGRTELSTLLVFFALLGGLNAFGLIGLIAGPLVFSLVLTLYSLLKEMRSAHAPAEEITS